LAPWPTLTDEDDELPDLVQAMGMHGDEDSDSDSDSDAASEASSEGSAGSSRNGEAAGRADAKISDRLTRFLQQLMSNQAHTQEKVAEFAKLSEILVVVVGGSVEDERLFSAASFVLSKHRCRLDRSLEKYVRMKVQGVFCINSFSYEQALQVWHGASVTARRMVPKAQNVKHKRRCIQAAAGPSLWAGPSSAAEPSRGQTTDRPEQPGARSPQAEDPFAGGVPEFTEARDFE
jgi:hypothetical protein